MAKKACHCKKAGECEECPEWIFTFADLVMLMMGFFVILWVLKPNADPKKPEGKGTAQQQEQWNSTVGEIRAGFGWEPDPTSSNPIDVDTIRVRERLGEGKGGKTDLTPHGPSGAHPEVQSIRHGKQAIIGTRIQFVGGQSALDNDSKRALDQMVKLIQGHEQIFIVKGHASMDDLQAGTTPLPAFRMDLSLKRAQAVADYLTSKGVDPRVLRVQGCSTFEPVAKQAYTEDRNAQNRRAEVESSDNTVGEVQDRARTTHILSPGVNTQSADAPMDPVDHR